MKKLFLMIILQLSFISCSSYPQIKVTWDMDAQAAYYKVYYCAGNDTSLFPIKDGVTHQQVWDWWTGDTLYPYFYVKNDGYGDYYRVGVIKVSFSGDYTTMTVQTYKRIKLSKPTGVKALEVKE